MWPVSLLVYDLAWHVFSIQCFSFVLMLKKVLVQIFLEFFDKAILVTIIKKGKSAWVTKIKINISKKKKYWYYDT